jgi:hypothetical protein
LLVAHDEPQVLVEHRQALAHVVDGGVEHFGFLGEAALRGAELPELPQDEPQQKDRAADDQQRAEGDRDRQALPFLEQRRFRNADRGHQRVLP